MPGNPSFRRRYVAVLIAAVAAVAAMLLLKPSSVAYKSCSGEVWTTEYHITYRSAADLADSVQAVLRAVDGSASAFNPASRLSQVNAGATDTLDAVLAWLYTAARRVYDESGGAYDPTVMPLVDAWGFGHGGGTQPTQDDLDSLLCFVGLDKTSLDGRVLHKADPRIRLDFGSIAKGMACDEVGRMLRSRGVGDYLVEIGGEVVAAGLNPRGQRWHVSVDMPVADTTGAAHDQVLVLELNDRAVATSGSYRRFHDAGGRRVSHIVDPRTGRAAPGDLLSVTVIASTCALADAWATACMALGRERTHSLMNGRTDLGVMTINADDDGNLVVWSNATFATAVVAAP